MKHVFETFVLCGGRTGYSVADITFYMEAYNDFDTVHYGKERKTMQAAINDAKRYFAKHPDLFFSIYAIANITEIFDDDGTVHHKYEDCARIGTLDQDGEYFDLCEQVRWL